jgi:translocation and assembly module TamB
MRRPIRWLLWGFSGLLAVPLLALIVLTLAAHSQFGRMSLERSVFILSAGQVVLSGLSGDFLGELAIKHMALQDASGTWLTIDGLLLNWLPTKLMTGEVVIERLQVQQIAIARLPVAAGASATPSKHSFPLDVNLRSMQIERIEIALLLAGQDANFGIEGRLRLTENLHGEIELHIQRLNSKDAYHLQGSFSDQTLNTHLSLQEAAQGLLAKFAGLRNQGALNLEAAFDGPLSAVSSHAELKLDGLLVKLAGKIDFVQASVDLTLAATAPSMQLRQDLDWQALALDMQLQGSLDRLNADGSLHLEKLTIGQATIGNVAIKLKGSNGLIDLAGTVVDIRLASAKDDLLQAVPLVFQAKLDLDKPDYPASVALQHPMVTATGHSNVLSGQTQGEMLLTLPNVQPLAALGSLDMAGNGTATVKFTQRDADSQLSATGILNVKDDKRLAKLLGKSAKFDLVINTQGNDIAISTLFLDGKTLTLSANGGLAARKVNVNWLAQFKDLSAIVPTGAGKIDAQGQLFGDLDDLTLLADLKGGLANKGYASRQITANLQFKNLPHAPNGRMNIAGALLQAPIDVQLTLNSIDHNNLRLGIDRADWKSAHAQGRLMFTQKDSLPVGKIELQISHLADLQPLVKWPLTGSVNATLESILQSNGRSQAKLKLEASHYGLDGAVAVDHSNLALTINDPSGVPKLKGLLALNGISAGKLNGLAQMKLDGPLDALGLHLSATLPNLSPNEAHLNATALLNSRTSMLTLNTMKTNWGKQAMHLLVPVKVDFNDGLAVDRLRLGWQQAELELGGRFSPELALTVELHNTPAQLLSLFAPNLAMTGMLHADAQLHGSLQLPTGLVRFNADKLQMQQGSGKALPPAKINATAVLQSEVADLNVAVNAGNNINVHLTGQMPLTNTGRFNLSGKAALDLKLLDPILTPDGQQLHGQLVMNTKLAGTWLAPNLSGDAQLNHGQWQDYVSGTEIGDITAAWVANEGKLRLVTLQARAGPGTLTASGSVDLMAEGLPIAMNVTAHNARPLASDQLTVNLDADLVLGGLATQRMTAAGHIRINRAEIRIPERMPTSVAVLKFSNAPTMPPPKVTQAIGLDLTIAAPREIFIRGRGLNAELGGTLHVAGTTDNPEADGTLKLRSGQFRLAGQTLVFDQGGCDLKFVTA